MYLKILHNVFIEQMLIISENTKGEIDLILIDLSVLTQLNIISFCFRHTILKCFSVFLVVEDDEDDFPLTRSDGDFLHNTNGNKEKCKCCI